MNIFIMILVFVLIAGYYLFDSPSQKLGDESIESVLVQTEIKSILACVSRAHAAAINADAETRAAAGEEIVASSEPCVEKYNVSSTKLCSDERRSVEVCTPERVGKSVANFVVTTADLPTDANTNLVLKTLAADYSSSMNFGIIVQLDKNFAILSGNGHRRSIPASIASAAELKEGNLVYITQYSASAESLLTGFASGAENIACQFGEQKIFRFSKWECLAPNPPVVCTGDTIWDSDTQACIIDPSRRPLCSAGQTPAQVDDMWKCLDPTGPRTCPNGMPATLDFENMEWVCVATAATTAASKCDGMQIAKGHILGGTLLKATGICSNCETMITNPDTCETACVPDASKLSSAACYPNPIECSGGGKAFYFGFPASASYIAAAKANVPQLSGMDIIIDKMHSQNRKFNCLDCGAGGRIDSDQSNPPFTAVCE